MLRLHSTFTRTTFTRLIQTIAATAVLGMAASAPAGAGSLIAKANLRPAMSRALSCHAPLVEVRVCTVFGQASSGQLFGPCLRYEYKCESPAYTGQ